CDRLASLIAGLGVHHLVERGLHTELEPLRELVENVAELVEPVALLACLRPHVAHRRPEAEGPVAHGNDRRAHPPALQVAEDRLPALGALPAALPSRA